MICKGYIDTRQDCISTSKLYDAPTQCALQNAPNPEVPKRTFQRVPTLILLGLYGTPLLGNVTDRVTLQSCDLSSRPQRAVGSGRNGSSTLRHEEIGKVSRRRKCALNERLFFNRKN